MALTGTSVSSGHTYIESTGEGEVVECFQAFLCRPVQQPGRGADQQEWEICIQQGVRNRDEVGWLAREQPSGKEGDLATLTSC